MSIVQIVGYKINHQLLNYHALVNFHILVKARNKGVHLLVNGWIVGDFSLNYCHFFRLAVLSTELRSIFAVFVNFFLKSNLSKIQLVALC